MRVILFAALFLPFAASGADFARCLLSELPGTANDVAAYAIWNTCKTKHPGGLESVEQGSGLGWFGFKSGDECTAKKAGDTPSRAAVRSISSACNRLYDSPSRVADKLFEDLAPKRR